MKKMLPLFALFCFGLSACGAPLYPVQYDSNGTIQGWGTLRTKNEIVVYGDLSATNEALRVDMEIADTKISNALVGTNDLIRIDMNAADESLAAALIETNNLIRSDMGDALNSLNLARNEALIGVSNSLHAAIDLKQDAAPIKSAAFAEASEFATAAQGALATSSVQPHTDGNLELTANGTGFIYGGTNNIGGVSLQDGQAILFSEFENPDPDFPFDQYSGVYVDSDGNIRMYWPYEVIPGSWGIKEHVFGALTNSFATPVGVGNATNPAQALNQIVADTLYADIATEDLAANSVQPTTDGNLELTATTNITLSATNNVAITAAVGDVIVRADGPVSDLELMATGGGYAILSASNGGSVSVQSDGGNVNVVSQDGNVSIRGDAVQLVGGGVETALFSPTTNYFSVPITVGNATHDSHALNQTVADALYADISIAGTVASAVQDSAPESYAIYITNEVVQIKSSEALTLRADSDYGSGTLSILASDGVTINGDTKTYHAVDQLVVGADGVWIDNPRTTSSAFTNDSLISRDYADGRFATAAQGGLADSAIQPEDSMLAGATSVGAYDSISIGFNADAVNGGTSLGSKTDSGMSSVAVGMQAVASERYGVSIGYDSSALEEGIAIGKNSHATTNAIQLGEGNNTIPGTLQIYDSPFFDFVSGELYPDVFDPFANALGSAAWSNSTDFVSSSVNNLTAWNTTEGGVVVSNVPSVVDGSIARWEYPTAFGSALGVWHFDGDNLNSVDPLSGPALYRVTPSGGGKFGRCAELSWGAHLGDPYSSQVYPQSNFTPIDQNTDFSVEYWMKSTVTPVQAVELKSHGVGKVFDFNGNSKLSTWQHFSFNYNGQTHSVSRYIDGKLVSLAPYTGSGFTWNYGDEGSYIVFNCRSSFIDDLVIKIGPDSLRISEFTPPTVAYGSVVPPPRLQASTLTESNLVSAVTLATTALQTNDVGSAAWSNSTDFATAAQGALAETAVQPTNTLFAGASYAANEGTAVGPGAYADNGAFAGGEGAYADVGAGAVGEGAHADAGGFAGGPSAYAGSTGGAVGSYASSSGSGFAGGDGATEMNDGGAVGSDATSTGGGFAGGYFATENAGGGAIGDYSAASSGGAVGKGSVESGGGFAGGMSSTSQGGGAVGSNTVSIAGGFAGGINAKSISGGVSVGKNSFTGPNAIQLGTGTNNIPGTMQVYNWPLLDATGNIVSGRLSSFGFLQPDDLGSAAYSNATDFATAAQGALAETAVQPHTDGELFISASSNITLLGQDEIILVPVTALSVYAGAGDDPTMNITPDEVVIGPALVAGLIESPTTITVSAEDSIDLNSDALNASIWGNIKLEASDLSGPSSKLDVEPNSIILESLEGYKEARVIATNGTVAVEWKGGIADSLHRLEFGTGITTNLNGLVIENGLIIGTY